MATDLRAFGGAVQVEQPWLAEGLRACSAAGAVGAGPPVSGGVAGSAPGGGPVEAWSAAAGSAPAGPATASAAPAGDPDERQRAAAAAAVRRRFAVVAGGPGTGKTTTVARIVALLAEQAEAAGVAPPLVALAAPTGKAQARLQESVHAEARTLEGVSQADPPPELLALEVARRCTGCSDGVLTATAASVTTAAAGCRTTS